MTSNFAFLSTYWPDIAEIGRTAEDYVFSDPNACMYKLGLLGERIVAEIMTFEGITAEEESTQADRLKLLRQKGILPPTIDDLFYSIRKARNDAVHAQLNDADQAMTLLRMAYSLSLWFMEVYGDGLHRDEPFAPPTDRSQEEDFNERMSQQEKLIDELLSQVGEIRTAMSEASRDDRAARAAEASEQIVLTEDESNRLHQERIRLDISAETVINYALNQNGVPILRRFRICNHTEESLDGVELTVTATPEFCHPVSMQINCVPADTELDIKDLRLSLNAEYMASLVERETGVLRFCLRKGETVYADEMLEMTSLAFDEWHGSSYYPELLASFVTPNHPEVIKIVARAAEHLGEWTGDPSLDAYYTQDPNRVMAMAAAVYAAMQEQEIVYAVSPASFSHVGQRVRLCDTVIRQKMGNCLDLTLMYAACLESIGLHPILLLLSGHIFAGVWLEDSSFPETVQDDASLVTKRLADGVNEMAVVECTAFTAGKSISFDSARRTAEKQLLGDDPLEYVIDVKRARLCGVLPLPRRICTDDGWCVERESTAEEAIPPERLGETITVTDTDKPAAFVKQMQWERKLLDLCLRNQLINLRLSKSILPILAASLDELENGLADGSEFTVWGRPTDEHIAQSGASFETLHDLGAYKGFIQEEFRERRLHSTYRENEITGILKDLYRSAKVAMEENGANTLYLALGLLRWFETDRSTKPRYAPLVLLPVELVRKASAKAYVIRARDDEPQINVTILEKLKQDFQLTVNGLESLPQDEHGLDLRRIFTIIRKAIMRQPKWDVLESAYLGTFSFSQFVMWNDIRNRSEDLKRNKIVRGLIDGRLEWDAAETAEEPSEPVLLPLPADASQMYAIETAFKGESFVLHGPPGTGKSQTITALIANALAHGRTVLFVAEKIAALEVVQRRLNQIGIGDFCLELHSNKSKKRDVLEQLRRAFEVTKNQSVPSYENAVEQISRLRGELDAYVNELHKSLPCGMSLYELINLYEETKKASDVPAFSERFLRDLTPDGIRRHVDLLERAASAGRVVGHPCDHPFASIRRTQYQQRMRDHYVGGAEHLYETILAYEAVAVPLRVRLNLTDSDQASVEALEQVAKELLRWQEWPRAWSEAEDAESYLTELSLLAENQQNCLKLAAEKPSLWQIARNYSADLKNSASACGAALKELQSRGTALSEFLGMDTPSLGGDNDRVYVIATELERWSLLPAAWSRKAEEPGYFTDVINMAQHFINAAYIRSRYEGVWSDDFWSLDGVGLLASYREAFTKWMPTRALGLNKLYRSLIPYGESALSRGKLNTYLTDLVKYQEEKRLAEELYARLGADIEGYTDGVAADWEKVKDDALYAKINLNHLTGDSELAEIIQRFAGQRAFHDQYVRYLEAKENRDRCLSGLETALNLDLVSGESRMEDMLTLCQAVEESCDILGLWLIWQSVAASLCSHIGSVDDRAPFEMAEIINARFLPLILKERLSKEEILAHTPYRYAVESVTEVMADYRLITAYMNALGVVMAHMDTYAPALSPENEGKAIDWQTVREQAAEALESVRILRELTGSDELRGEYALIAELRPELESVQSVTAELREAYDAFSALLQIEDNGAPDWLRRQKELCQAVQLNHAELKDWFSWNASAAEARAAGLENIMDAYVQGLPHGGVLPAYRKAISLGLIQDTVDNTPILDEFAGSTFNEKIDRFKKMDREMTELTRKEIFCRLAARVPSAATEAARNSEISILQRAIRSGGRGVSIRKLFEQLPNLLPQLCPCMLMSPISAAQYLDPKREPFDIVVFDEASQLPTCKAVGAVARGKSAVIVGDPKQMPPTSFFATNVLDEEHLEQEDLASILDDCLALQMPQTHLKWHYRSRHESLIAFSNSYFYENKLYTFPSSSNRTTKVSLQPVQGTFERGKSRQNRAEAEAVVADILRRYRDPDLSRLSVGVVTFNVQQQNLIDDLLEDACSRDPELSAWVYDSAEPLFIKNLENVQGDERDVILFSIGYGPDERGQIYMNFGPLNREGGWRR